jgi:hypothetical protein
VHFAQSTKASGDREEKSRSETREWVRIMHVPRPVMFGRSYKYLLETRTILTFRL